MSRSVRVPDLIPAVAALPQLRGEFSVRVWVGRAPPGALRLDAPTDGPLSDWLKAEIAEVQGADDKLAAAYLLGSICASLADLLSALALRGWMPRDVSPGALAIASRRARWEANGESGEARAYDVVLIEGGLEPIQDLAGDLGTTMVRLMTHVVEALYQCARLSRAALWRIVGDALSAALLLHGKEIGKADEAMAIALRILRDRRSPLYARQTRFVEISLPECPDISEWFRARGGCCRAFTSDAGDYCTTCVLRDEQSRTERLRDYLRRKHGVLAA